MSQGACPMAWRELHGFQVTGRLVELEWIIRRLTERSMEGWEGLDGRLQVG